MESSWAQILAWRMRRQFLDRPDAAATAADVADRLAGVQAQVASAAELAVALRRTEPSPGDTGRALWTDRSLVKTWAMRGTLHLLPAADAAAYLALSATVRNWEKPSWQRTFGAAPADLEAIAAAAGEILADGAALTREELTEQIIARTASGHLAETLASGWGTLLKPLAWWGVLCYGPPRDGRVTFTAPERWLPGWKGMPPVEEAARTVIRAFLGAHGPADPQMFDAWLMRGQTRRPLLRSWFALLEDELTTVRVDGRSLLLPAEHAAELAETPPSDAVRLLGAFDPYVLGAGTGCTGVVPAAHRAAVSRKAGWISPVILDGGRVVGTWEGDRQVEVTLFRPEAGPPADRLTAESARMARLLETLRA